MFVISLNYKIEFFLLDGVVIVQDDNVRMNQAQTGKKWLREDETSFSTHGLAPQRLDFNPMENVMDVSGCDGVHAVV